MTRLTKDVRERMVRDLLLLKFEAAGKALCVRSAALFHEVYEDQYDDETRRLMRQIEKRMKSAFRHIERLDLNVGGWTLKIGRVQIGVERITFYPEITPQPVLNLGYDKFGTYSDCPLAQKLRAFMQDTKTFADEIAAGRCEALGALSTITTAKQLSEMWPEAMPIIGKHIPMQSGSNVPAVQFAKLTESFGLDALAEEA
jgi:Nucleotide modification associated domain 5